MPPTTYKVQDGCHNCARVLDDTPQDDGTYFYCNLKGLMDRKTFYASIHSLSNKKYVAMRKWMGENEVEASGICDNHKVRKEK